jgi:hypothetical protein
LGPINRTGLYLQTPPPTQKYTNQAHHHPPVTVKISIKKFHTRGLAPVCFKLKIGWIMSKNTTIISHNVETYMYSHAPCVGIMTR